jgi:hypothetical protein
MYKGTLADLSLCFSCATKDCPLRGNRISINSCDEHLPLGHSYFDAETKKALHAGRIS